MTGSELGAGDTEGNKTVPAFRKHTFNWEKTTCKQTSKYKIILGVGGQEKGDHLQLGETGRP